MLLTLPIPWTYDKTRRLVSLTSTGARHQKQKRFVATATSMTLAIVSLTTLAGIRKGSDCQGHMAMALAGRHLPLFRGSSAHCAGKGPQHRSVGVARLVNRDELFMQDGAAMKAASQLEVSPISEGDLLLNTFVFLAGLIPFAYAAWEFWRRIAFGQSFGTGNDPVVFPKEVREEKVIIVKERKRPIGREGTTTIGMDADTNRGRKELGTDALVFAYVLMFLAGGILFLVGIAVYPALTRGLPA